MDPAPVPGIDGAVELALGDDFSCARRRDGTAACWGNGASGQLGDGKATSSAAPRPVEGLAGATMLRAGQRHVCALSKKGEVFCWGDNRRRAIVAGSPLVSKKAVPVFGVSEPVDAGAP